MTTLRAALLELLADTSVKLEDEVPERRSVLDPCHDLEQAAKRCAELLGIDWELVTSSSRARQVLHARWVIAAVLRMHYGSPEASYPRLGEVLGQDHSTVMHGVGQLNDNEALRDKAAWLSRLLSSEDTRCPTCGRS